MAEKIPMLALSPTMEQGTIVSWVKKEGEAVTPGDVLCEVETDKATMEYETSAKGTLLKILAPEGSKASVGDIIAIIGAAGEDISAMTAELPKMAAPAAQPSPRASTAPAPNVRPAAIPGKTAASPRARKLAAELGVDLDAVAGTGPAGRVVERDIVTKMARPAGPASPPTHAPLLEHAPALEEKTIPVTDKRRLIATRMSESASTSPHFYLTTSVNMDAIVAARQELKDSGQNISLNAFLMRLAADALKHNPGVNASWHGQTIVLHGRADIALAVAQPDGLVAPVVRSCDTKSVSQIDEELRPLVEAARAGKLSSEAYSEPTFTISNLGTFDIEQFTAIINPPASAILAVGKVQLAPTANQHTGAVETHHIVKLTLSCDHRVIDGAAGAKFLHDLKVLLESPALALL